MGERTSKPFVIAYGAEEFFLDRDLARAKTYANREITYLNGAEASEEELLTALDPINVDGSRYVVIVDNAHKVKETKGLRAYVDNKDPGDDSVIVVAIVRAEKLSALWQAAAKKGRVAEYKKLKTFETNNEVLKWIPAEAARLGFGFAKGMADVVYANVGADLYRLSNELNKLAVLVGKNGVVQIDHLRMVLSRTATTDPYKVAEAAAGKDLVGALNAVSTLYQHEGDDVAVPIVYSLMRHVEKMIVVRTLLDKGTSEEEIAARIGMHPWRCKTFFIPQVRRHSFQGLCAYMGRLCKLDANVKTSDRSRRTALELAVVSLAT